MKENKKLKTILSILVITFMISFVSAGYILGYFGNATGHIIGGNTEGIIVLSDIYDFDLNTTEDKANLTQEIRFSNNNGVFNASIELNINKVLLDENCTNYETDCKIVLANYQDIFNNGDTILINSGYNYLSLDTSCIKHSCLQDIEIDLTIQEIIN